MAAVLFVCLGNICRSPLAEGIFRAKVSAQGLSDRISVDSAGTSDWHIGNPPDSRSFAIARANGIDLSRLTARQVTADDFFHFTHILAMDASNLHDLAQVAPPSHHAQVSRMLGEDVPDPYYGGDDGFARVFDMLSHGCDQLLSDLIAHS